MKTEVGEIVRKNLIQRRKALSLSEVKQLSTAAVERFLSLFHFLQEADLAPLRVGLYRALPSELDLTRLEVMLSQRGHLLHYPRVVRAKRSELGPKPLQFVHIPDPHSTPEFWQKGSWDIQEPHSDLEPVSPESLDLIFVPGVAFGESGERIGMGAGYYDRFLMEAPQALRVALAFDFQVLPNLEQKPWDQAVHCIVTEQRSFQMPFVQKWLEVHTRRGIL